MHFNYVITQKSYNNQNVIKKSLRFYPNDLALLTKTSSNQLLFFKYGKHSCSNYSAKINLVYN
jgi:hypothetical protein